MGMKNETDWEAELSEKRMMSLEESAQMTLFQMGVETGQCR